MNAGILNARRASDKTRVSSRGVVGFGEFPVQMLIRGTDRSRAATQRRAADGMRTSCVCAHFRDTPCFSG
jgi:hypothetical protein